LSAAHTALMPNPLYEKLGGHMVLTVPLIVFMDNVLGNISKQCNKHHVFYMSNASMPCEMLEKEFCTCFVSSSPHATPFKLIYGVKESIEYIHNLTIPHITLTVCTSGRLQVMASLPGIVNFTVKSC
ncbi:hypothetical protein PAXRUDRAFT_166641, partial [Paxillus rubicundulus Ve08.2h10]